MGKRHNKGGSFRTLKPGEVPDSVKAKMEELKILKEQKQGGPEDSISGRMKEFINIQKEYHNTIYNTAVIGAELEEFMVQLKMGLEKRMVKWNGMVMTDAILKPRIGLKNIAYKEAVSHLKYLEKALTNKGLSKEEIQGVGQEGKYIKELPGFNTGVEAPKVKKG